MRFRSATKDKRRQERKSLLYHLKVLDSSTQSVVGYLGNISRSGLLIYRSREIAGDGMGRCLLTLVPPPAFSGAAPVELKAKKSGASPINAWDFWQTAS